MFRFRNEHLNAFSRAAMEDYEDRVVDHLRGHLVELSSPFTDQELRKRIQDCVCRAATHGLTTEFEILCFVDATFLLDINFDRNPAFAWAAELLQDGYRDAFERAEALLDNAYDDWDSRRGGEA